MSQLSLIIQVAVNNHFHVRAVSWCDRLSSPSAL